MASQSDLALQMVQQLRILDPSISAEIGTPERKIIDTVAQSLADSQIDLTVLASAFDLDSKVGTDLDRFLSIFGFGRQQGSAATGYVTFSRVTPSVYDIPIPRGTQVLATVGDPNSPSSTVTFFVSEPVTLDQADLSVITPIEALSVGTVGNVAAGTIRQFGGTPILGITALTNDLPTTGGLDPESDDELKVRFKNTVFRNLAGTYDQFLALAVQTQFTTKANVVGPISRYREYIQVPAVDDASVDDGFPGNGSAGEYTTALSTVPYSKHTYSTVPFFVSLGANPSGNAVFYREDLDFRLDTTPLYKNRGDAYRLFQQNQGPDPKTASYQPTLTFLSVYTGDAEVDAISSGDIVLFEHSYMSTASRNDYERQILNCVDVYINGQNPTLVDAVFPRPTGTVNLFTATGDRLDAQNFRRVGEPERRPILGNIFTPLYWTPITDLPDIIVTSDATYFKGIHYWPIIDVSPIGGTVRARTGIEWSTGVKGKAGGNPDEGPYTGPKIVGTDDTSIEVTGYSYDRNINDLQVSMETNKQVTSDVLAHQAKLRYFKLDVTVMYQQGSSTTDLNGSIQSAVQTFLSSLYFGSALQLSDFLQTVHNVSGVDNVRWSQEVLAAQGFTVDPSGETRDRIVECDINGNPLLNVLIDRRSLGDAVTVEVQQAYLTGASSGGTYKLISGSTTSVSIAYDASAATVQTQVRAITGDAGLTVTGSGTSTSPFVMTFSGTGIRDLIEVTDVDLTGGPTIYNADFFLNDNELPSLPTNQIDGDSVPGLIIRTRAQNTWNQL